MSRYRLEYAKNGTARFLSHRELMTTLQRALRRASFPLTYSKGYNPRPKLSFGPPLGVGVAGLREYMDLELTEDINIEDYLHSLNRLLLPGIHANSLTAVPSGDVGLGKLINCGHYLIDIAKGHDVDWEQLLHSGEREGTWCYERPGDGKVYNVSEAIIKSDVYHEGERLIPGFLLKVGKGEVPLRVLLGFLADKQGAELLPSMVTRTGLYQSDKGCLLDPLGKQKNLIEG